MTTPEAKIPSNTESTATIRWWPAIVVLAVAAVLGLYIWRLEQADRQMKIMQTGGLIAGAVVLLLLWLLLLSRLSWKWRLVCFGGAVGLLVVFAVSLKVRGVTGDLLPVVEWRWSSSPAESLPVESSNLVPPNSSLPTSSATDYPQLYGPDRNGKQPAVTLLQDWQAQPPKRLWRQPIGTGWSGFSVVGSYAFTMEQRGDSELVTCYDARTGNLIWSHADPSRYATVIAGEGPRTVPTLDGGRVYTVGATGICNCLDMRDGSVVWSRNIVEENESSAPEWGISCSPLVAAGKVIVSAGGDNDRSLIAYDAASGELIWSSGEDRVGYSSPVLAQIDGVAQVLIFNGPGVKAHHLASGQILWEYPWPQGHPHIVMPVVLEDDRVLISSGYGTGSELIRVARDAAGNWSTSRVWKSNRLKSKFANVIVHEGYIYGLDDGIFVCLELASGKLQWKRGRYGHGQMILVDELLLVMAENGDLVLLQPSPESHRELARLPVLEGKTWNPPALTDDYLLVRNDMQAACYRLPSAAD